MATDVLSVSGTSGLTGRPYDKAQRSQARPKHSLFGAEIQHFDTDEHEQIKKIDLEKYQQEDKKVRFARQSRYKTTLPDYLKKSMFDANINETRRELEDRISQANRAKHMLGLLEEKSKYYQVGTSGSAPLAGSHRSGQWMTEDDLKNVDKMNRLGVCADRPGYNRDKYQEKPLSHQYSLIGDPMKLGMDFSMDGMADSSKRRPAYKRHRAPDWLPKEAFMKQTTPGGDQSAGLAVQLPPNIQHQYGTNVCRNLLGDKDKVEATLERQRWLDGGSGRKSRRKSPPKFPEPPNPEYESLSQSVRQNMFPGYTINHKSSLVSETYTRDVFDRRVPDPDQFRYQRDELSTWAEHNVLRDRVKKAWDNKKEEAKKG